MFRNCIVSAVCLLGLATTCSSEVTPADSNQVLKGITERGRDLFAYDQAAWQGTDAFFQIKPETRGLAHYVCSRTPGGWVVTFPRWNETHDRLLVVYEARQVDGKFVAMRFDKPSAAPNAIVAQERALELASKDFGTPGRPYNSAILPASDGSLYVYLYPGQTKENVWPLGGDVRYTISADGTRIVEKRRLHEAILEMEIKPDQHQVSGYHTHTVSELPEDTDVLYVLNRKPSMPEFIATGKQLFVVAKDGTIESGSK